MNVYLGIRRFLSYHLFQGLQGNKSSMVNLYEPNVPTKKATFAMGCFWFPDGLFGSTPGVVRTRVGYTGGTKENPTYRSLGDHTETTDIDFDPEVTNYGNLLSLFWANHDPTVSHKAQYKSAIYYRDDEQKQLAIQSMAEAQKQQSKPIVTDILPVSTFYDAEMYHQKYKLQNNPSLLKSLGIKDLIESHVAARLNGYVGGLGEVGAFESEWSKLGISQEQADYVRKELLSGRGGSC